MATILVVEDDILTNENISEYLKDTGHKVISSFDRNSAIQIYYTNISNTTEQMEQLDKSAICIISTKDEIGKLAQNVNSLYKSLLITIADLQTEIDHVSEIE